MLQCLAAAATVGRQRACQERRLIAVAVLHPQFFVVGHDCGHRSFSKNKLLEDIVGTLMFAPLIYPFEPWRIKHNHHHAHTNKCASEAETACRAAVPASQLKTPAGDVVFRLGAVASAAEPSTAVLCGKQ